MSKFLKLIIAVSFVFVFMAKANDTASNNQFEFKLPLGISIDIWNYYVPKDNPLTQAKVELGKRLFFDKQLSVDGTVSCATCHDPERAFTDGKRVSEGIQGRRGTRNAPTILNAMFNSGQFWDGRAATLEEQAILPLTNLDEMGNASFAEVVERLKKIPEYKEKFHMVFHSAITIEAVGKAIAAYERTLVSADSPFDRFQTGDFSAMTDAQKRGLLLFRAKARCNVCHRISDSYPFFSDQNFRNTGVAANHPQFERITRLAMEILNRKNPFADLPSLNQQAGSSELGRFSSTGNALDIGTFRTPSLRNIELTAPYFHDGSASTLEDVVRYYMKGGNDNSLRDWELQALDLSDDEVGDLIAFLKALTSTDIKASLSAVNQTKIH
ncbi:MAG: cytochrome c peroxidase [Acidobacteriota bacterium]